MDKKTTKMPKSRKTRKAEPRHRTKSSQAVPSLPPTSVTMSLVHRHMRPPSDRQESSGTQRLDMCRQRLAELERTGELDGGDELHTKNLATKAAEIYERLLEGVESRLEFLEGKISTLAHALVKGLGFSIKDLELALKLEGKDNGENVQLNANTKIVSSPTIARILLLAGAKDGNFGMPGPNSGRDAALALSWIEGHEVDLQSISFGSLADISIKIQKLTRSSSSVANATK